MRGGDETIEGVIASPARLDVGMVAALADHAAHSLSRARVQALIGEGRVTVAGIVARQPSAKVAAGTPFAIAVPPARPAAAAAQDIALTIVHEDAHLIVVDKPAGLVVHPAVGNLDGTLVNALLHHCAGKLSGIGGVARPGIVHRIDKDTSGLLVVAKTDLAHEGLARQFADHSITRAYLAVTGGVPVPGAGRIEGVIGRSDADRKKMAVLTGSAARTRGKRAVTHYRVIERLSGRGGAGRQRRSRSRRMSAGNRPHAPGPRSACVHRSCFIGRCGVWAHAQGVESAACRSGLCAAGATCGGTGLHPSGQRRALRLYQPNARRHGGTYAAPAR